MLKGFPRSRFGLSAVLLQCLLVMAGTGALLLAPPAEGAMLLVPAGDAGAAINAATAAGGRLAGRGVLPGSVVVIGRRDAMLRGVIAAYAMLIAARPALCEESVA